jgi:hypothetical protein
MKQYIMFIFFFLTSNIVLSQHYFFGDIHVHTNISDGTCAPQAVYEYAKNITKLDFICVTDHENWPANWDSTKKNANTYNEDGKFVAFVGYEFSNTNGHRIVIYPDSTGTQFKSWNYNDTDIISLVHAQGGMVNIAHPNLIPIASAMTSIEGDQENNIEILSSYQYEYYNNPNSPPDQLAGSAVQDWIFNKKILGFLGVTDSHTCDPGRYGLTGVLANSLSRSDIFNALLNRHTFATNGEKIKAKFSFGNYIMGDTVHVHDNSENRLLEYEITGTSKVDTLELIKNNNVIEVIFPDTNFVTGSFSDADTSEYSYYYIRAKQEDGGIVWTSPIYFIKGNFEGFNRLQSEGILIFLSSSNQYVKLIYKVPEDGQVNIKLFDLSGKYMKTILDEYQNAGIYNSYVDINDLMSGLYFIRISFENIINAAKFIITK